MSELQPLQTNFTSGEVSPYMWARTELQQYANSARQITNFVVRPQGGLLKRSGTIYVAQVKNSANYTQLVPFEYSNTDTYVIEMGAGYYRFYRSGGQILSSTAFTNGALTANITGWTTNISGTGGAAYNSANGGVARLSGGSSGRGAIWQALPFIGTSTYTITCNVYTNTITYNVGTTINGGEIATGTLTPGIGKTITFTPTTEGTVYIWFSNSANNNADISTISINTPVYQITNPFSTSDLPNVRWAQSYDTLYMFHNSYPSFYLQRAGHAQWTRTAITFTDGPYYDVSDLNYGGIGTGIVISSSATALGSTTLTASSPLFLSTDVGRLIRYRSVNTAAWGWAIITAYSSATSVTATIKKAFDASGTNSQQWRLGYFSASTGYPAVGTIFQQRLVLAGITTKKQTMFFSVTADLYNMQPDDTSYKDNQIDTSAMVYTIADNTGNVITGFSTLNWFFVYTSGGVWVINSNTTGTSNGPITPSTIALYKVVSESSSAVPPAVCRTSVLYTHIYGRKLLDVGYNFATNLYTPTDLATLAEQRTVAQIQWSAVQTSPNYIVWNMMQDGTLSAVTYYKEQQITGWHEHTIAGTNAQVKAITAIPGPLEDQIWMIVSRTINGSTVQYIEYFAPTFLLDSTITDAMFLDCAAQYIGGSTTTITGLSYLEGQNVTVFGNGGVVSATSVTGGSITLQTAVTQAWVGLPFTSVLLTNVPTGQSARDGGSTHGRLGRVDRVGIQFYNSYGGKIGMDSTHCNNIPSYGSQTIMGQPISLFTGLYEYPLSNSYTREPTVYFEHSLPVPIHIAGMVYRTSFANAV